MTPIKIFVKENLENLKDDYNQLRVLLKENDEGEIFDKAYNYLEFKDRISSAKGFQSMYFFIRNLITLLLTILPAIVILYFFSNQLSNKIFSILLAVCILGIIVLIWMGKWYREKLIIKVYKTCLIALTTENKTPIHEH